MTLTLDLTQHRAALKSRRWQRARIWRQSTLNTSGQLPAKLQRM